jgi:hypothetical protein
MTILMLCLLFANSYPADANSLLPEHETRILTEVADEYKLTGEARRMLFVIRRIENGGDGKEMGVLIRKARRFKGNESKSLRLQARWAAGTLRKRWTGSIEAFANVYCPPASDPNGNKNWIKNAKVLMNSFVSRGTTKP